MIKLPVGKTRMMQGIAAQMISNGRLLPAARVTFVHGACGHSSSTESTSEYTAGKTITVVGSSCLPCAAAARAVKEMEARQERTREIGNLDPRDFFMPDDEWIAMLSVGDDAPYVFGWSKVVEIKYRGVDVHGRPFVGYTVDFGNGSTMSASAKSGMLQRTMKVCNMKNSSDIDRLELAMRDARGDLRTAGRC